MATLNPRGLVYTAELIRGIERFSGAVSAAEREIAEASCEARTPNLPDARRRRAMYIEPAGMYTRPAGHVHRRRDRLTA